MRLLFLMVFQYTHILCRVSERRYQDGVPKLTGISGCCSTPGGLFECKSSEERVVYKELNSTETLIQRTTMEAPQKTYVLHRAGCSQEDDQLLRKGR
jgi:hypothetical protein